ncbi:MAG: DciA family protein [Pseudomonadota bacterium]
MSKKKDMSDTDKPAGADQNVTPDAGSIAAKNAVKKKQRITPMAEPERRAGLRNVAPIVSILTRPLVRKRGFFQAEILVNWGEIVGRDIADLTMPVRYAPPRGENAGGGTLTIRVAGVVALELQHRMPQIIERVNTYFGYRAVERIKMMQGDIARPERTVKLPVIVPDGPISSRTEKLIEQIEDPALREVLTRLGRHISGAARAKR